MHSLFEQRWAYLGAVGIVWGESNPCLANALVFPHVSAAEKGKPTTHHLQPWKGVCSSSTVMATASPTTPSDIITMPSCA